MKNYKLILTSRGLTSTMGSCLIGMILKKENLKGKDIFVISFPKYGVDSILKEKCIELGFETERIHLSKDYEGKVQMPFEASYFYVTEGNSFEVWEYMKRNQFDKYICKRIKDGGTYIGSSAGAMIAGDDIVLAQDFDKNFVGLEDYKTLGLFEGTIIPHYSYKQFQRYKEKISKEIWSKYQKIYFVDEHEVLYMKISEKESIKQKRFRLKDKEYNM